MNPGDSKTVTERLEDNSCLEVLHKTTENHPGIVGARFDTIHQRVGVDYDKEVLSDSEAELIALEMAHPIRYNQESCSLRIKRQGGRACESCALVFENQVRQIPGVRDASASFRSGVMKITYDQSIVTPGHLRSHVAGLGLLSESGTKQTEEAIESGTKRSILTLPIAPEFGQAVLTLATLLATLGGLFADKVIGRATPSLFLYAIAYAAGGYYGLKGGLESLRARTIDIDLLMILAALGAAVVGQPFEGALLLFLFSLSNTLQDYAMDRTRSAIKELMTLRPTRALLIRSGELADVSIDEVIVGDIMLVRPGDRIPLDGRIVLGESQVDQSPVTGESIPVSKEPGDEVYAGTINQQGALEVRVTRLAADSTIARLIRLVEEAQSEKAVTQRFIDRAEQYYAMGVIGLTTLAIFVPFLGWGVPFSDAFYRAMTILVAASPCALVISTPATILSAIGNAARRGILFKGGAHVEKAAEIKTIAFDKTGTLTIGRPQVTDVVVFNDRWSGTADDMLALSAAVQTRSEHTLARAVLASALERDLTLPEVLSFQSVTGKGVSGIVAGTTVHIGNARYFQNRPVLHFEQAAKRAQLISDSGKTCVYVAIERDAANPEVIGLIAFADVLRPGVAGIIARLKQLGISRVVMLTGDNEAVARQMAEEAGVDAYFAELLPEDKLDRLKQLRSEGPVAMVGDGINDAPALAGANVGIAMGAAGTDVAIETADVILMSDRLENIPYVIELSRRTRRTLIVNLAFAVFMIVLMITVILGWRLALPLAVVGHEGSTVLVSLNGLRLLAFKPKTG